MPWLTVSEDGKTLIASRCDFIYPKATEDEAGPRDESRFARLGHCDGDICIPLDGMGSVDLAHLKLMLATLFTQFPRS